MNWHCAKETIKNRSGRVNEDSKSKNILGKTWEKLAGEKYKYFMVFQSQKVENTYTAHSIIEVLKGL